MHPTAAAVPAKRHHSQISNDGSSCSRRQGGNPLESFMHMFGSFHRPSSRSQQMQQMQQPDGGQQQQQARPSSSERAAAAIVQRAYERQDATDTEYDAMLSGNPSSRPSSYVPPAVDAGRHAGKPRNISPVRSSSPSNASSASSASAASAWRTAVCPRTSKIYYWNVHTRESRWKKPLELASEEEREAIRNKERKQREFFEAMERNILRRLEDGRAAMAAANAAMEEANAAASAMDTADGDKENNAGGIGIGFESPMSAATSVRTEAPSIDSSWMKVGTASPNEAEATDDWIAGWITPTSETASNGASPAKHNSPSHNRLSLSSIEGLSVFDAAASLCGGSLMSDDLASFADSCASSTGSREERDDKVLPLKKPSKIERIKSASKRPVIDKPDLIRTISRMEYDLLARQLNPSFSIQAPAGRAGGGSIASLQSPKTVGPESKRGDEPLTPTAATCDILSSLSLSYAISTENEGVNVMLPANTAMPVSPASPLTPTTPNEDEDEASLPIRSLSSPASAATEAPAGSPAGESVAKPNLTKRNTCGTIYLGSTLSAPDKDALIKCVCGVYRAHLLQSELRGFDANFTSNINDDRLVFHDRRAPGDYRSLDTSSVPTLSAVTDFYRSVFLRSQMEIDCIIISLIYVERLIKLTHGKLTPQPNNWRSILFSCMVLASKVWDDLSMWNCDFSKIGPSGVTFSLARTNELEIALLRALGYRVKVNASEYAKYYFLLRGMLCRSGLADDEISRLRPLDVKGAMETGLTTVGSCESGGGDAVVSAGVAKASMKERSKSYGDVEKGSNNSARMGVSGSSSDDGSGSSSPQGSPSSKRVSLEQIVRM